MAKILFLTSLLLGFCTGGAAERTISEIVPVDAFLEYSWEQLDIGKRQYCELTAQRGTWPGTIEWYFKGLSDSFVNLKCDGARQILILETTQRTEAELMCLGRCYADKYNTYLNPLNGSSIPAAKRDLLARLKENGFKVIETKREKISDNAIIERRAFVRKELPFRRRSEIKFPLKVWRDLCDSAKEARCPGLPLGLE